MLQLLTKQYGSRFASRGILTFADQGGADMETKATKLGLKAARGTLLSIALRLTSFILSQATVRFVSAAALGKASVPLELLLGTALFVSREGFRLALTKDVTEKKGYDGHTQQQQQMINVAWLSVPLGIIISMFAMFLHIHTCNQNKGGGEETQSENEATDYKMAGILYCLASFIESLSEPLVIICLQQMDVTTKAKSEGFALVSKSVSCFVCLSILSSDWAVSAFGISQLIYGFTFTMMMYRFGGRSASGGIHWPKRLISTAPNNPYRANNKSDDKKYYSKNTHSNFDYQQLKMVLIFTLQGLFKHALTEADKIVLSALAESYDQGIYAIAASYGGLAARLLLQPIEENARLLFSRQGAIIERDKDTTTASASKATSKQMNELQQSYSFLLRTVCLIGLLFSTIAVNYTSILLRLLAGYRWGSNSEAIAALSAFCVYTAFLSLNGITEAFVYAVARSGRDIGRLSIVHALVGGVFALLAPGLVTNHAAVGLVSANCISMALRSLYSLYVAWDYFADGQRNFHSPRIMLQMLPRPLVVITFATSFVITRMSKNFFYDETLVGITWMMASLKHVGVGLVCTCVTSGLTLWLESDIWIAVRAMVKK
jgi:oligosaccharide translocation protein RFT1